MANEAIKLLRNFANLEIEARETTLWNDIIV